MDKRRQVGLEAAWFNQFSFKDRPAPVVEARESHVIADRSMGQEVVDFASWPVHLQPVPDLTQAVGGVGRPDRTGGPEGREESPGHGSYRQ
jgi:hypothetical protein